jgi:hypothetical protein
VAADAAQIVSTAARRNSSSGGLEPSGSNR